MNKTKWIIEKSKLIHVLYDSNIFAKSKHDWIIFLTLKINNVKLTCNCMPNRQMMICDDGQCGHTRAKTTLCTYSLHCIACTK